MKKMNEILTKKKEQTKKNGNRRKKMDEKNKDNWMDRYVK